jgi:acetyl esterase/lipase
MLMLLVICLCVAAAAARAIGEPQTTQPSETRYLHPLFADVEVSRDVTYKETTDSSGRKVSLQLDVYRPKDDTATSRPAIIWVHGGALSMGSKDQEGLERRYAEAFARRGYVTLSINYRLRPNPDADWNGAMMDAMSDVASALAWLRANAEEYGVDRQKVVLAGYSAGAEIVTNLCYSDFVRGMDRHQVAAVVDIAGNTLFFSEPSEDSPPCLIVHGTGDTINPYSASEDLRSRLAKRAIGCELFPVKDADHFFNRDEAALDSIDEAIARFLNGIVSQ